MDPRIPHDYVPLPPKLGWKPTDPGLEIPSRTSRLARKLPVVIERDPGESAILRGQPDLVALRKEAVLVRHNLNDDNLEDIYIAVMGMTGAGKSSFIQLCTESKSIKIGHGLRTCTQETSEYSSVRHGIRTHFIDTPGFDDTNRSNREILGDITAWFESAYKANIQLTAILYLHRIVDSEITGTTYKNMKMFKQLCGEDFFPRIWLCTTFWDVVSGQDASRREAELIRTDDLWGSMVEQGSTTCRHYGSRRSAMGILQDIIVRHKSEKETRPRLWVRMQRGIQDKSKTLQERSAREGSRRIFDDIELLENELRDVEEYIETYMEEGDHQAESAAMKHKKMIEAKLMQGYEDQERLRVKLEAMELQHLQEFQRLPKVIEAQNDNFETLNSPEQEAIEHFEHVDHRSLRAIALREEIDANNEKSREEKQKLEVVSGHTDDDATFLLQNSTNKKLIPGVASEIFQCLENCADLLVLRLETVSNMLPVLLNDLSQSIIKSSDSAVVQTYAVFTREYRMQITRLFHAMVESTGANMASEISQDSDDHFEIQAQDKEKVWRMKVSRDGKVIGEFPSTAEEQRSHVRADALACIITSQAWEEMILKILVALRTTPRTGLAVETINQYICGIMVKSEKHLQPTIVACNFILEWDPVRFIKKQYRPEEHVELEHVITLVRSGSDLQASTCGEYLKQTWPSTGKSIMDILQKVISDSIDGPTVTESLMHEISNSTRLSISMSNHSVVVKATGTIRALAETGEILCWLGAACQVSPYSSDIALCTVQITAPFLDCADFYVKYVFEKLEFENGRWGESENCWHSLFRNPIVIQGFPTLARLREERGIEIPLNMMGSLGGAEKVTRFNNGLVLKGFSSMFVPIARSEDSIQWHFFCNPDSDRLSYCEADDQFPHRLRIKQLDMEFVESARHFVGWSSSVLLYTGTKNVDYEGIEYTGANYATAGCAFEGLTIAAGKYITAGATFKKGNQDTPLYLSRDATYLRILGFARKMNVVLFDVQDRRGWLVDGTSALLHLTRAKLSSDSLKASSVLQLSDFTHAEAVGGRDAAWDALKLESNMYLEVFKENEPVNEEHSASDMTQPESKYRIIIWRLKDLVREVWDILEQILDYQVQIYSNPAVRLRSTTRDKLEGFGFKDIVEDINPLKPRVAILNSSGRGWVDFTRQINSVNLLGSNFGQIFKPAPDSNGLCAAWREVPKDQDYLAACVWTLQELCKMSGNPKAHPLELVQGIYWNKPGKLFESCTGCLQPNSGKTCDRIQVLLPQSLGSKTRVDPFTNRSGAVIFGRNARYHSFWKSDSQLTGNADHQNGDDITDQHVCNKGGIDKVTSTPSLQSASSPPESLEAESSAHGLVAIEHPASGHCIAGTENGGNNGKVVQDIRECILECGVTGLEESSGSIALNPIAGTCADRNADQSHTSQSSIRTAAPLMPGALQTSKHSISRMLGKLQKKRVRDASCT